MAAHASPTHVVGCKCGNVVVVDRSHQYSIRRHKCYGKRRVGRKGTHVLSVVREYVDQASLVPYRSPQYPDAPIRCNRHAGDSLQVLTEPQRMHSLVCRHFATTPYGMSFGFPQRHCPAHSPRPNRPPDFHGQLKIIEDMDRVLPIARDSKAGTGSCQGMLGENNRYVTIPPRPHVGNSTTGMPIVGPDLIRLVSPPDRQTKCGMPFCSVSRNWGRNSIAAYTKPLRTTMRLSAIIIADARSKAPGLIAGRRQRPKPRMLSYTASMLSPPTASALAFCTSPGPPPRPSYCGDQGGVLARQYDHP